MKITNMPDENLFLSWFHLGKRKRVQREREANLFG